MTEAKFSIGIDLGTSNSALAFCPLTSAQGSQVLAIPQWDTPTTVIESEILPSFLYLPEEAIAAQMRGQHGGLGSSAWVVGRLARRKASETPGRVAQSAKSWLCHHAADRSAPFLPWGSNALAPQEKISPVSASALILAHLRKAWNDRFAAQGFAFDAQDITITVPASFDAAAQMLTLAAARQAGFPDHVRLLEEPQAAFYAWLEQQAGETWAAPPDARAAHVLVIDIGGGTTDFSLFELKPREGDFPDIKRVAVSDHILLGGDNIDLAIAHLVEPRLATGGGALSPGQWDHLAAQSRSLKERVLGVEGGPDEVFTVSIPGRGSNLIAGALSAEVTRSDLERMVLEGFFPDCEASDKPRRALGAVREWGLPYAFDSAVTRHLAAFLRGRPEVDALLFNGGSLTPRRLREKLRAQIGRWQEGRSPIVLENPQLDLAVARGAAYSGRLARQKAGLIEAGSPRAVFVEAGGGTADGGAPRALVCILPRGATSAEATNLDLYMRINTPVRFQLYTSTRHDDKKAGDVVELVPEEFHALPPLETVATLARPPSGKSAETIPVALSAKVNELGLLQLSCRSLAADIAQSWPLEFNLRPQERAAVAPKPEQAPQTQIPPDILAEAKRRIASAFTQTSEKRAPLTAPRLFQALEQILGRSKGEWNAMLLRELWESLKENEAGRALSVEHEETWLIFAGFLLRPGFGVARDERRIDELWRILEKGLRFPGKRSKLQQYILWRRVAGGLSQERQEALLEAEKTRIFEQKNTPPELIRMAGSFERIGLGHKTELIGRFIDVSAELAAQKKHCAPYLAALGSLLSRTPFYAGPENIAPPELVERAYKAFRRLDWNDPELAEMKPLFLRAARVVNDRRLDLPAPLRKDIADKLEKCGVAPVRAGRLRDFEPVERAEHVSFYGEALPPGLILGGY